MDRRERLDNLQEALIAILAGFQSGLWTSLPCIVTSFDPAKMTCVVKPALTMQLQQTDGTWLEAEITQLLDVPVVFPSGGGYTLTFPVVAGDECLVVFSARCIDNWWLTGGVQSQAELRMHDLSDGFAFVGVRSQPRILAGGVSTTTVQLRNDAGTTRIELAANDVVNIVAPGGFNVVGPFNVTGATAFTGTVAANGKSIDDTHAHSGVTGGPSNTGPVV